MGTLFEGVARKIAVPFIGLTGIGWLLVVIGFGLTTVRDEFDENTPVLYPQWMVSFCGPLIIGVAIAHAASWQPASAIIGAATSFLNVLWLTALGMVLYVYGNLIRLIDDVPDAVALHFAGSLLATFFWTPVVILWNFYDYKTEVAGSISPSS